MSAAIHPASDTPAATAEEQSSSNARHPRLVLTTCILASSLAFVDGSVVNVGLPSIGRSLGASSESMQWVINAYLLPLSALLLLGGAAGDRFGRRRLLIAGTLLFATASLACALAPGIAVLLGGRLVQGVGAAMLMPSSLAILGATFSGDAKGRAIGIWAASGAAMGALGPVLGGWLIDAIDWRAIFLINLPLAFGAAALAWRYVPVDADGRDRPIDVSGAMLATVGLAAATWSLTLGSGPSGWTTSAVVMALAATGALVAFVMIERGKGERAMTPPSLFASSTFIGLTVLTALLYGALGMLFVMLPYLLVTVSGYSSTAAGAALVPLPLVLAVSSPAMGAFAARVGARLPLSIGPVVVAAGFALMLRVDGDAAYWTQLLPAIMVIAVGMSGAVAPLTTAVLTSVDDRHAGSASGFNSAVARTGGLIATALVGSVLAARGDLLVARFHVAALICTAACLGAAVASFTLVRNAKDVPAQP